MHKKGYTVNTIGIFCNLRKSQDSDDLYEEYDSPETIDALSAELKNLGFNVIPIEQDDLFFDRLLKAKPDFCLNLAEGIGSGRSRESQVPCILETLGIPYSGSDPVALGITMDKYLTNKILCLENVPVPEIHCIKCHSEIDKQKSIFSETKVFIAKPRWEGSSKGIFDSSRISNYDELKNKAGRIIDMYSQPVVLEEFLPGAEITAGVAGNSTPKVIGMMRIAPTQGEYKDFIYSLEKKRSWREAIRYFPEKDIAEDIRNSIHEYAVKAFKALELRDIARIDFRLDKNNVPKIIDVNPLPGLSPVYSDLPIMLSLNGKSYAELIQTFLSVSFERHSLRPHQETTIKL